MVGWSWGGVKEEEHEYCWLSLVKKKKVWIQKCWFIPPNFFKKNIWILKWSHLCCIRIRFLQWLPFTWAIVLIFLLQFTKSSIKKIDKNNPARKMISVTVAVQYLKQLIFEPSNTISSWKMKLQAAVSFGRKWKTKSDHQDCFVSSLFWLLLTQ